MSSGYRTRAGTANTSQSSATTSRPTPTPISHLPARSIERPYASVHGAAWAGTASTSGSSVPIASASAIPNTAIAVPKSAPPIP